jgi:hypothetical protein
MSLRYLDLCNKTLRRMNEVEISEAGFSSTRGVQSLVKDAVQNSINQINQSQFEWPFNAAQETSNLVVGRTEYAFPAGLKTVDKKSFQLVGDGELLGQTKQLMYIDRDQWYNNSKIIDDDASENGRGVPSIVFNTHGFGFGVSPAPDKPYRIRFRYYLNNQMLQNANDVTRIPDPFEYVIIDGAIYHMYMFKDNPESATIALTVFQRGISNLRTIYINDFNEVYDRRVNFGGGVSRGSAYFG